MLPSVAASLASSTSPSQRATTMQATALPMKFVSARHSDMNRSMPRMSAMPTTGTEGTTASVAASVMKPEPVTPAAPFEESIATRRSSACSPSDSGVSVAWAMNSAAIVM